ncbi:MAG: 50S ribosomal protein L24 [Gammaproteobacteria bacterium]|nr:50S ribosomal protein L24 [Gammaproteobacteria bacterium]NNK31583.1 50S ribosomal protein L24 [Xanthomonadales bacterium]
MKRIRKGDEVIVTTGRSKGQRGHVLRVLGERLLVENVNMVKKHQKPNPAMNQGGGIVEKESPIHVSNVSLYNPGTGRGDRVSFRTLEDGRKVRIFQSTGEAVDI